MQKASWVVIGGKAKTIYSIGKPGPVGAQFRNDTSAGMAPLNSLITKVW